MSVRPKYSTHARLDLRLGLSTASSQCSETASVPSSYPNQVCPVVVCIAAMLGSLPSAHGLSRRQRHHILLATLFDFSRSIVFTRCHRDLSGAGHIVRGAVSVGHSGEVAQRSEAGFYSTNPHS